MRGFDSRGRDRAAGEQQHSEKLNKVNYSHTLVFSLSLSKIPLLPSFSLHASLYLSRPPCCTSPTSFHITSFRVFGRRELVCVSLGMCIMFVCASDAMYADWQNPVWEALTLSFTQQQMTSDNFSKCGKNKGVFELNLEWQWSHFSILKGGTPDWAEVAMKATVLPVCSRG